MDPQQNLSSTNTEQPTGAAQQINTVPDNSIIPPPVMPDNSKKGLPVFLKVAIALIAVFVLGYFAYIATANPFKGQTAEDILKKVFEKINVELSEETETTDLYVKANPQFKMQSKETELGLDDIEFDFLMEYWLDSDSDAMKFSIFDMNLANLIEAFSGEPAPGTQQFSIEAISSLTENKIYLNLKQVPDIFALFVPAGIVDKWVSLDINELEAMMQSYTGEVELEDVENVLDPETAALVQEEFNNWLVEDYNPESKVKIVFGKAVITYDVNMAKLIKNLPKLLDRLEPILGEDENIIAMRSAAESFPQEGLDMLEDFGTEISITVDREYSLERMEMDISFEDSEGVYSEDEFEVTLDVNFLKGYVDLNADMGFVSYDIKNYVTEISDDSASGKFKYKIEDDYKKAEINSDWEVLFEDVDLEVPRNSIDLNDLIEQMFGSMSY